MMKVLIVFAHPRFEQSRAQAAMLNSLPKDDRIVVRDLYELYPDFRIDVEAEQASLTECDVIVWQHPLYWYSAPPLMKQWIDLVLEYNWAYGPQGRALEGKWIFNSFSSGGGRDLYHAEGKNRFSIADFLRPFEQTARLCRMRYLPAYALLGTHRFTPSEFENSALEYGHLMRMLMDGQIDPKAWSQFEFLNDYYAHHQPTTL